MQVLFHCPWTDAADWLERLRAEGPEFVFLERAEVRAPAAIEAAVVWRPPAGLFAGLDQLRGICVMGAGVDALFAPGVDPPDVPIVRLVDPVMTERMASYVLAVVLYHQRELGRYRAAQAARAWRPGPARDIREVRIGVLGLGEMGRSSAELLARVGYDVAGWARSPRSLPGIRCYAGAADWPAFLARCDVLVCLLPLTPATRGILDRATFAALPEGAVVINAARGAHLVEPDLLAALDGGRLAGAALDVLATEPLPPESPLWAHPKVLITPHIASLSNAATGVPELIAALRALRAGRAPANLVDRRDYLPAG